MLKGIKEERARNDKIRADEKLAEAELKERVSKPEALAIRTVAEKAGEIAEAAAFDSGANRMGADAAKLQAIASASAALVVEGEKQHGGRLDHNELGRQ